MDGLTALVLSLCSLLEAEGNLLQENILRTLLRSLLLLTGVLFAIATLAFFMAGIYDLLLYVMPRWLAFACLGLLNAVLSLILFRSSRQWGKKKRTMQTADQNSAD